MKRMPITRLTPIVPGEAQPFVFVDGSIQTGFITGGPTEGLGFPQWAKPGFVGKKVHYFGEPGHDRAVNSLCGRISVLASNTFLPGNFARCEDCRRRWQKMMLKKGVA